MRRTLDEFLNHPFPAPEPILGKWLTARSLVMLAGFRGVGKTFASLGIATAVASGAPLLGWAAGPARGVLLVDGEMDPAELQGRLRAIKGGLPGSLATLAGRNLAILTHADFENGIPNLADPLQRGRRLVEEAAEDCELIILDNLSTLTACSDENASSEWQSMQDWLVGLRRRGKAVLLIHHGGKPDWESGRSKQRGTSKREDVLNTSVMLHRPPGMSRDKFLWEWTKTRGWVPDPDEFTVRITWDGAGGCTLEEVEVGAGDKQEEAAKDLARVLHGEGYTLREIELKTKISRSVLSRMFKKKGDGE